MWLRKGSWAQIRWGIGWTLEMHWKGSSWQGELMAAWQGAGGTIRKWYLTLGKCQDSPQGWWSREVEVEHALHKGFSPRRCALVPAPQTAMPCEGRGQQPQQVRVLTDSLWLWRTSSVCIHISCETIGMDFRRSSSHREGSWLCPHWSGLRPGTSHT